MAREISIRLAVEDADRVKAVLQSVGATGEQAFAAFERGATSGAQSFAKLERSLDPVVGAQQRFATAQAGINRALEAGLASQERAGQLLDLARRRYLDLDDATTKVATGSSKLGQVIGQAGFQVQDFVVQVGSGQNALVALGQQGSQLLGVFGNFGAVAGAGLAILAMAANMAVGKTAAEKLSDELDRQQAEYEAVSKRAQDYQTALRAQGDQYRNAAEAGQRYREGLRGEGETLIQLTRYYQGLTEAKLGYERAQFTTTTQNNATNTYRLGREITRTLNRPMLQAVPDGAAALDPTAIIGGGGLVPSSQPDYQQATAAIAQFRRENKVTEEAVLQLRQALQGAVELNGSYAASINAMIGGLDTLIPQLERLDEAQRRANNRRLAMAGQASPEQLRALADQAANDVGGTYQQRQRIQELRGDLRGGLPGANPEQAAAIRSSLQSLAAQQEGLTPATTQMLRGLQDQARLANVAAGAARDLAASDQALDNAARQAGLGQATLAEKTEARRLVQRRLDGQLMDSLEALNRQITGAEDLAAAQLQGAGAVREVEARLRAETETLKVRAEADADYTRIVEVLTTRYAALAEAQALARSNAAELGQQQQLETLRTEAQLVGATVAQRERELAVLRERQKLTQEGVTDGAAQARRLALAGQIADETQALKRQQDAWTELSNVGVQAFDRIGQAITTALSNGQLSTIRFGNIAKAVMAEVVQYFAKVALVNPVLNAVFGSNRSTLGDLGGVVGSVFGGSGGGAGGTGNVMIDGIPAAAYAPLAEGVSGPVLSIPAGATYSVDGSVSGLGVLRSAGGLAAAQGGGVMSQLGMLSSGASVVNQLSGGSLYGGIGRSLGLTGQDGLFTGVGESITSTYQNIAATPLGSDGDLTGATNSALGAMPNGMYGPATESAVAAQGAGVGTLGQVAGGAAGVIGGAYGIYSGIQKGGVGGGFQVAGGAVTAAAGVSSLLASAGIISASLGPVGWIAGAVLAIIGALLPGQKPSNMEGNATYDFATDSTVIGGQTGKKYSQGNRDAAASMIGGVVDVASRLERTLGITFNQKVAIGVGNRDGIYYRVNDGAAARYGRSDQGAQDLARDLVHEITVQSAGQIPNAAVRIPIQSGVRWDSLSGALQQIQQVLDTTNGGRPSANQNIAAEHIDWRDFGNGLADLKWVKDTYDTLTASQLPADKFARAVQQLNDQFDAAANKAAQLGLSEAAVNAARARQLQGLTDQRDLEGLKLVASQQNTLTSFLDNLTYQNASPAERLSLAQGAFGQALEAARGGDIRSADLSTVTKSAATLLQAGQAYYGTGGSAADLERFVRSSIESLGAQLNLPAFGGDLEASLSAAVNPLKDELQLLRDEVAGLREELRTSRLRLAA